MANFYALPGLNSWSQVGGWSASPGGPSNGIAQPSSTDNVFFDSSSGPSRTITLSGGAKFIKQITFESNANAFTLSGDQIYLFGTDGSSTLQANTIVSSLYLLNPHALFGNGATVGGFQFGTQSGSYFLFNVKSPQSQVGIYGDAEVGEYPSLYITGPCTFLSVQNGDSSLISLSGDITITGSGSVLHFAGDKSISSATFKFTNATAQVQLDSGQTYAGANMWNATTGAASLLVSQNTIGSLITNAGSKTVFSGNSVFTTFKPNGAGGLAILKGTSDTVGVAQASINVTAGIAFASITYCSVQNIALTVANGGGPVVASYSTNLGGTSGISFLENKTHFMSFM